MKVDVVDQTDQVIGTDHIQVVRQKGLRHRYVRTLLQDKEGHFLLQLRGPKNFIYPNCWDFSSAGHVDPGESYESAAARELFEETGIINLDLHETEYYSTDEKYDSQNLLRLNKTFSAVISRGTLLKRESGEVSQLRWFSPDELSRLVFEDELKVTPALIRLVGSIK